MKAKISIVAVLFILFAIHCNAQEYKRGWNWVTGYSGNRVHFGNSITTSIGLSPFKYFSGGNSCIGDTTGNLVLASDGYNIYNKNGILIEDGDTLVPLNTFVYEYGWASSSQASIFLPFDNNK